jgi:hypothetical protein
MPHLSETHSYTSSPYYQDQYQAANGKVVAIEHPFISTISDFKEPRTSHILAEEWVYIGRKKVRVLMIDRPLEGDLLVYHFHLFLTLVQKNHERVYFFLFLP